MKLYLDSDCTFLGNPLEDNTKVFYETDKKLDMNDIFFINNKPYIICTMPADYINPENKWAKIRPLNKFVLDDDELDEEFNEEELICPVCGANIDVCEFYESDDDFECPDCGSTLDVEVEYTRTFYTKCTERNTNIKYI